MDSETSQSKLAEELAQVKQELEKTKSELKSAQERHIELFENSGDSIIIVDAITHRILDVNENTVRRLGYRNRDELTGLTLESLEILPADMENAWESSFSKTWVYECAYQRYDGSTIPVEVSSRLAKYGDRPVLQNFIRDISYRKLVESQRLEMEVQERNLRMERERARLLEEFLENTSHDLKSPLSVIQTALYLLERVTNAAKKQQQLSILREQTSKMNQLLEDMLAIVRIERIVELETNWLKINEILQQLITVYKSALEKKDLRIVTDFNSHTKAVRGDAHHLSLALRHLLVNAINYTPEGGTITLKTYLHDNQFVIEIQDTGVGIQEQHLDRIFERFFRVDKSRNTRQGGTGLGLAIVKKVIDMHNGSIEVESQPEVGSTFCIKLPII